MSTDTTALVVIAIALSLQTLLMIGVAIWTAVTWRRAQAGFERQFEALVARADVTLEETRRAAEALHRCSEQASTMMGGAGHVVQRVATMVGGPRSLLVAGAVSAARGWAAWRRRHPKRVAS